MKANELIPEPAKESKNDTGLYSLDSLLKLRIIALKTPYAALQLAVFAKELIFFASEIMRPGRIPRGLIHL
ncbi:MAG TPA: hypothetical protein VN841_08370 [Bryobacteraceae bacterium]|nr:hypothetical protein [Bryobacteraceae bacterium]